MQKKSMNFGVKEFVAVMLLGGLLLLVGMFAYSKVSTSIPTIGTTQTFAENVTGLNQTTVALTESDTITNCLVYNGSNYAQALSAGDYTCGDAGVTLLNNVFNNTQLYASYTFFNVIEDANTAIGNARTNILSGFDLGSIVFLVLAMAMVVGVLWATFG